MRFEKAESLLHLAIMMQGSAEGIGLQDIQEEFNVGRRTAERMRDAAFRLLPQIEEVKREDKTKRWRMPARTLSGLMQITADDLAEMKTAIDYLKSENLSPYADSLDLLWLKLKGMGRPDAAYRIETDLEALLEAEGYALRPGPKLIINSDILYTLRESIKSYRKVSITYRSRGKGETTTRTVCPYGFIYGKRHYLIAWCDQSNDLRTFSLPYISDVKLLSDSYEKKSDFDLKKHTEKSFGIYQEEPYKIVWKFAARAAEDVREYFFHPTQILEEQPDGSIIVSFTAGGWKEICWHIMTWEGDIQILEPQHLKDKYQELLQQLMKAHQEL